jgi:hypothetical protein
MNLVFPFLVETVEFLDLRIASVARKIRSESLHKGFLGISPMAAGTGSKSQRPPILNATSCTDPGGYLSTILHA